MYEFRLQITAVRPCNVWIDLHNRHTYTYFFHSMYQLPYVGRLHSWHVQSYIVFIHMDMTCYYTCICILMCYAHMQAYIHASVDVLITSIHISRHTDLLTDISIYIHTYIFPYVIVRLHTYILTHLQDILNSLHTCSLMHTCLYILSTYIYLYNMGARCTFLVPPPPPWYGPPHHIHIHTYIHIFIIHIHNIHIHIHIHLHTYT